ncbi:MAG TPA: hypothetical protein VGD98_06030, partial [Ktedonobacteraceae bacterium]
LLKILLEILHEHEKNHAREALGGMREVPDQSGLDPINRPTMVLQLKQSAFQVIHQLMESYQ